ncbi:MAG: polyprenyl synthetase family protein [Planctomycetota bacterium]
MSTTDHLAALLEESRAWADAALDALVPPAERSPTRLYEAMRYALFGGGKRLRPAVARMIARELAPDGAAADAAVERPAAALELVHTYSLVHDDLPCMDDDALRRGRPTVHVAYDEATAVLVGDALLTLAFEVVAGAPDATAAAYARVLGQAAGAAGMVGGQVLDLSLPQAAGLDALRDMHARKTAALFGAAAEMGAIAGGAGPDVRAAARDYGVAIGLCFQATDDLLDVTGDAATLGKTPGKDAALERATLVTLLGEERARDQAGALADAARGAAGRLGGSQGLPAILVDHVLGRSA